MREKYRKYIALSLLVLLFCTFSASAAGGLFLPKPVDQSKTFGLSPQTGEYEVLTDGNSLGGSTVNVSLVSTQGPTAVKVRVYTKNSGGTYELAESADVTFEKPLSCNVAGAAFQVTAEFAAGTTGNCTLHIKAYAEE